MEGKLLMLYLAGLPVLGFVAQWLAWRLRLPSILLLLGFGIILGRFISPDALLADLVGAPPEAREHVAPRLLFPVVSLAVAVILFEGGLTLRWREIREVSGDVWRLCTVGVAVSWGLTTAAAVGIVGLDLRMAALLGAILVVTGPTVITPLLRHVKPSRRVGSILRWEGIVVDPIGAVLAVLVFEAISAAPGDLAEAPLALVKTVAVGLALGLGVGAALVQVIRRFWIPDFLQGMAFLTATLAIFAMSNWLQVESGLVAVTVLGIYLANQTQISIQHVLEFKEHLVVLLVSCLFIVLGSRLELAELWAVGPAGLLFLAALVLVIRPATVFISTLRSSLTWRERTFIALLAPRGIVAAAVTSVFALEVSRLASRQQDLAGLADQAARLVPLMFFVIVGTVTIYGLCAAPLARWLRLADANPQGLLIAGAERWIRDLARLLADEGFHIVLVDTNHRHVSAARMAGLNAHCASILSEFVEDELDLAGVGRLLALTPNDEVNSLAAKELQRHLGRQNVFQLPPWDDAKGQRQSLPERHRGRALFVSQAKYDELVRRIAIGEQFRCTRLSHEFTYDDFLRRHGAMPLLLFLIDENRRLLVNSVDKPLHPKPGHRIVTLAAAPDRETLAPAADTASTNDPSP